MLSDSTPVDSLTVSMESVAVTSDQVLSGDPTTASLELLKLGPAVVGIWEMTAGSMRDTEVDEVFVVLDGEATVSMAGPDGDEVTIELHRGSVCRLSAGTATRWDVPRYLRKMYITGTPVVTDQ